jgi:hypothetical protein
MELYIGVLWDAKNKNYRIWQRLGHPYDQSVFIVDYKYRPWVSEGGNLLW